MPALNQNLEIWQDRTSIISFPVFQADGITPYTATTPTTANWVLCINNRTPPLLQKTGGTQAGGQIVLSQNAITGLWTAVMTLNPADTLGLTPQNYYHEMSILDNVGSAVNTTIGTINLQPSGLLSY